MPDPDNKYDLPFHWKKGDFKVDKKKLETKISSKIFYGNIKDSIDLFIKENQKISFLYFLIWIFSSTKKFLDQLNKIEKNLCPRVYCYFDDIFNPNHWVNEHVGKNWRLKNSIIKQRFKIRSIPR